MSNKGIIPERGGDDKSPLVRSFVPLCLIFVALISFGFGRLSSRAIPEPVQILFPEEQVATVTLVTPPSYQQKGSFVASKNGEKYYPLSCAGVNRIKEENKIYFTTQEEAESAGYSKAANCSF